MAQRGFGHNEEDRGVEGGAEEVYVDGERVIRTVPPALDGLGKPAEPEHTGSD